MKGGDDAGAVGDADERARGDVHACGYGRAYVAAEVVIAVWVGPVAVGLERGSWRESCSKREEGEGSRRAV